MKPAGHAHRRLDETRLLVLDPRRIEHSHVARFEDYLEKDDLVVVNRSATLPGSFRGHLARSGESVEVRLAAFQGPTANDLRHWLAISFGTGDWRQATEERGPAPRIEVGDEIIFGPELRARILEIQIERQLDLRFEVNESISTLQAALYRYGRPIQYSYLREELSVWDQQTLLSGPPLSVEAPSATFAFTWERLLSLKAKGVRIAWILHGAGLSSTGSKQLDALLPLREWYEIPGETAAAVRETRIQGGRVVAIGTTVLRALESSIENPGENGPPRLRSGSGLTTLHIGPETHVRSITHLVTGLHDLGASHRSLVHALCDPLRMSRAFEEAEALGYLNHEYGDLLLVGQNYYSWTIF